MSRNSKDIPAFPVPQIRHASGMQLRDYFAAAALQGMCCTGYLPANPTFGPETPVGFLVGDYAKKAYAMADAMLDARKL